MTQQLKSAKKMVEPLKTGELLVKEGFVSLNDIETALSIQKKREASISLEKNRLLGMILCDLNLITPVDAYHVLYKYNKVKSIQSELISGKMLSRDTVLKISTMAKQKNLPLISLLLKTGRVSYTDMQKLLFDLFHVPLKPVRDLSFNTEDREKLIQVMDAGQSGKNHVVPLKLEDNTLYFGITDPDNMRLLHQLREQFPQYRFKVVFIPYEGFWQINKSIYDIGAGPAGPKEESPDLSLLLKYRTTICSPKSEKELIRTLYHRYEQLLLLSGRKVREDRFEPFCRFIEMSHRKISRIYRSACIEFSLRKMEEGVLIIALPKREE